MSQKTAKAKRRLLKYIFQLESIVVQLQKELNKLKKENALSRGD